MSLDTKEDHPDGRRVANFAGDALMSLASWGTKTREECKEEVRRVDFRLHVVMWTPFPRASRPYLLAMRTRPYAR